MSDVEKKDNSLDWYDRENLKLYLKDNKERYEKNLASCEIVTACLDKKLLDGTRDHTIVDYIVSIRINGIEVISEKEQIKFDPDYDYMVKRPKYGDVVIKKMDSSTFDEYLEKNSSFALAILELNNLDKDKLKELEQYLLLKKRISTLDKQIEDLEEQIFQRKLRALLEAYKNTKNELIQQLGALEEKNPIDKTR